jgi:thiol-disulfide isomerase/thioredoxin
MDRGYPILGDNAKRDLMLTTGGRENNVPDLVVRHGTSRGADYILFRRQLMMRHRGVWPILILLSCMLTITCGVPPAGAAGKLAEGSDFPHFKAKDMSGAMIDTKQYAQGKVLLLDFWSIYCTSCIQEMPFIIDIVNRFNAKGLVGLSMDMDSFGVRRVQKFIDGLDFKIPYPTIIDEKRELGTLLQISMLPTVILVDTKGKVRLFHVGYKPGFEKDLEKIVQELLPK